MTLAQIEDTSLLRQRPRADQSMGILLFPAVIPGLEGRSVSFLISSLQVDEIVTEIRIWPVPFAKNYMEGIALWRNHMLPIVSLEKRLGIEVRSNSTDRRFIVVHTRQRGVDEKQWGMLAVQPRIRSMTLPTGTHPIDGSDWLPDDSAVRGVYAWNDELLIVADLETIFNGASTDRLSPERRHLSLTGRNDGH